MSGKFSSLPRDGVLDPEIELLDGTVQGLYALGLNLEYCLDLVQSSPDQATSGLEAAIDSVGSLIEPILTEIHRLSE